MRNWKAIPPWFNLDNYCDLANFTAKEWLDEIFVRQEYSEILMNPDKYFNDLIIEDDFSDQKEKALNFFHTIKKQPLYQSSKRIVSSELKTIFENLKGANEEYKQKFFSVQELSQYKAYSFFLNSNKQKEIENDCSPFGVSNDYEELIEEIKRSLETRIKYSHPIANFDGYEGTKFLEIDLNASDEQILNEFKIWLSDTRNSSNSFKSLKRQFPPYIFQDWYSSKILPYWDLINIARIENATIPFHVLGKALFPDEYEVDLAERIRKVTKKKCQFIFSVEVVGVLVSQVASEELQGKLSLESNSGIINK